VRLHDEDIAPAAHVSMISDIGLAITEAAESRCPTVSRR